MKEIVQLCGAALKPGGHGNLLCMASQVGESYQALSKNYEEEKIVHDEG